jgi:glycerophosphoryl diester phosphodiesterase
MKLIRISALFAMAVTGYAQYEGKQVLIAHRGASAYAPENTMPAFELAIKQGADYLENDIQVTKDGHLVILHDTTLERTTDVASVFPDRYRAGEPAKHWYVYDMTLAEIKKLDAGAWRGEKFRGTRVPTLQELIDAARGRAGLYIETKGPETYDKLGLDMEKLLMDLLRRNGMDTPGAVRGTPVLIQSFSASSLRKMKQQGCKLPLQLLYSERDQAQWRSAEALADVASFCVGLAPQKNVIRNDPDLVKRAHKAGLTVAVWTFHEDAPPSGKAKAEMTHYLREYGVDAVITNNPDQFPK